jgi:putative membrane protein
MMKIKAIIALVLVAMVAIFAIQNATTVDVKFLFWSLSVPRALLVLALLVVGFMLGITVSSFSKLKGD